MKNKNSNLKSKSEYMMFLFGFLGVFMILSLVLTNFTSRGTYSVQVEGTDGSGGGSTPASSGSVTTPKPATTTPTPAVNCSDINARCASAAAAACPYGYTGCSACADGAYSCKASPTPRPTTTPSCGSNMYWNGSSCVCNAGYTMNGMGTCSPNSTTTATPRPSSSGGSTVTPKPATPTPKPGVADCNKNANCNYQYYSDDGSYSTTTTNADGTTTRNNYDANGNLLSTVTTDKNGNISNVTPHSGSGLSPVETTIPSSGTDDGSYQTKQTNPDGSTIVRNYDKNGNLLSTVTTSADGVVRTHTGTSNALIDANDVIYYTTQANCEAISGGECTKIGTLYVNSDQVKAIAFYDKSYCEKITNDNCKTITAGGQTMYVANDCNCDEGCKVQPKGDGTPGGGGGTPTPNVPQPNTVVYTDCYKCTASGTTKYVLADSASAAASVTSGTNCTKVNKSYCTVNPTSSPKPTLKPTPSSSNPTVNPQTGTTAVVIAWLIGLAAIGYSLWYFKKVGSVK